MNNLNPVSKGSVESQSSTNVFSVFSDEVVAERAVQLAESLLRAAIAQQTSAENVDAKKLGRMVNDPIGKGFTFAMVDQVFRSKLPSRSADRFRRLIKYMGVPKYMPILDRALIRLGSLASYFLPGLVMKGVADRMRSESARVILAGEDKPLHAYLAERKRAGFRVNLNHLGEAVLGEEEASKRMKAVMDHLADPAVNYISVKVSAIYSQISLVAWHHSLEEIKTRLRVIYDQALQRDKFVNLDMEEYRDLDITVAAFTSLMDEVPFRNMPAGIVLQAYLPDSFAAQKVLIEWSRNRVASGGAPIKIRLVKGANLAMETVEAEMHGWHQAPYSSKAETDANFRRMMDFGCRPENAAVVRLGVASHNLFDVALALTLREINKVVDKIEIEMLEGMANHQARAVRDAADGILLYAPAVHRSDFLSAMAYLVRRLDENTSPENFLRDMFGIQVGSPEWERQKQRFLQGWLDRHTVPSQSHRSSLLQVPAKSVEFVNEPDTDWSQRVHRENLYNASESWKPASIPSLPDLDSILNVAINAQPEWESLGVAHRVDILNRVAEVLSQDRFRTLACLRYDAKKAVTDADGEVSEAVDFARYYARHATTPNNISAKAIGVVAVVSPWNFPYAIPVGGVLAALVAGNSVVLKPAPATVQTAWLLVNQLWRAGVPRDVLQFYPCDNMLGTNLIKDMRVQCVVLTGSYPTAEKFHSWRPSLRLLAETSGKNSMVITGQADRELAIKDLVRSAFGHSGQKCSAASLGILEAEVYDDPIFQRQLRDAAASLHVGTTDDLRSIVTPIVIEVPDKLLRALTKLDEGERWLLEPRKLSDDSRLWSPGIKLGVKPGSFFHQTECFGPVLGLMRAESLEQATRWQNATDYGLTAGIHSLDSREIDWWKENIEAGNLYINRPTTGAVVQRQPFGGWKRSSIGPGAKAGGPNYGYQFYNFSDDQIRSDDYDAAWSNYFAKEHDPASLKCESNVFRYRSCRGVILRLEREDVLATNRARLAAKLTGSPLIVSTRVKETDDEFIARLPELAKGAEFFRTTEIPCNEVLHAAFRAGLNWINAPFVAVGRIELTRWLREQSVSQTMHRYGQLVSTTRT